MRQFLKIALVAAPAVSFAAGASAEQFMRMVSGPAGGSWYPLGAKIMQVLGEEVPGIAASNGPGGGVSNVKNVHAGDAELGWSYAHTAYNGYVGRGKFSKPQKNIRHFATLYPAAFQVAVRRDSPIKTFADMKDKNLSPGKTGWTGTAFAESILQAFGYDFEAVKNSGGTVHYVSYSESVALMKDGHVDVFMGVTSVPQASFIDLNFSPGIRFIGLEQNKLQEILKANPGYIATRIPKTAYDGMSEDVPTLGAVTVLMVNADVPEDVVYNMAKVFWDSHAKFVEVKKVWNDVSLQHALDGLAIPLHPGAKRYYDEQGVKPTS